MSSSKLLGAVDLLEEREVTQNNLGKPWMESSLVNKVLGVTKLDRHNLPMCTGSPETTRMDLRLHLQHSGQQVREEIVPFC